MPGILLALHNCLLNGIKKKTIDVGHQRKWGIAKYWSWLVLGLGRQTTKILPCPLLVGIGKKSVSGPEDDSWFWADASIHWSSWWARLENPMAGRDLISEVWKITSHVHSGQFIKVPFNSLEGVGHRIIILVPPNASVLLPRNCGCVRFHG